MSFAKNPQPWPVARCTCGADIIWTYTTANNKMPVEPQPIPGGNVWLEQQPGRILAHIVTPDPEVERLRSHFATCPDACKHRRR